MTDRIDELLALAALGELTSDDERELDLLLADDADASSALQDDLDVAAALQHPAAEAPPTSLKADVMAAIDGVAQEPASPHPQGEPSAPAPVTSLAAERTRRRRWQPLAAAAAVLLVVAGGLVVASNRAGAPSTVDAVLLADDATRRSFEGELGALDVVASEQLDAFVVQGSDVPTVTETETYQVWTVDDAGEVRSVGLFRPDATGVVAVRIDGVDPTGLTVAITREPAGGSDTPTEPILAIA